MKFLKRILTLVAVVLALPAAAQITNGVKLSALPTPFTFNGTEKLPMTQVNSGTNATALATLAQVLAPVTTALNSNVSWIASAQVTETNARAAGVSNAMAFTTNQFNFATAYAYALSNQMQIAWLNEVTTRQAVNSAGSNNLNAASNVLTAAMIASNAALASAISTVAAGLGTTLTNGGTITAKNLNFTIVSLPAWNPNPSQNSGNTYTTNIDFNAGSYQSIAMTDLGQGNIDLFNPINWTSGQQVSLFVTFPNGIGSSARLYTGPFSASDYSLAFFPTTAHAAQLTWTAVGTNLFFKLTSY